MSLGKKLEPSEDLATMQVPFAIDLDIATSAKIEDLPILEQVLTKAVEDVLKRFAKDGFRAFLRTGVVRPMTQEELLACIPRKIHISNGHGGWKCATAHVASKNITIDWAQVTCKLCQKLPK